MTKQKQGRRRICIIGAGTAGIVATKTALEESDSDAEIVCYERSKSLGGIWWYRPEETEQTTVMEFTVTNTSKELSCFSDYPMPADLPTYLPHKLMLQYLRDYADHFKVTQCIRFNHIVHNIETLDNTRWKVVVEDCEKDPGSRREETFDAIMICIGHHCIPEMPVLRGQDLFKGRIIHAKQYKNSDGYRGKNVLVVGFGNSAADVAVSLTGLANQVYASVRRGTWMYPSHTAGVPTDYLLSRRLNMLFPEFLGEFLLKKHLQETFNHDLVGFTPKHAAASQQGTVNDLLPKALLAKQIILQPPIEKFTEHGVIFQNSSEEIAIDEVIFATGYRPDIPFIDKRYYRKQSHTNNVERLSLYKGLYSLTKNTLAFIGMVEASGNLGQLFEMQARHAMAVFNGKVKLPQTELLRRRAVESDLRGFEKSLLSDSDRHSAHVNKTQYMDMLAEEIKAKPDWWKLFKSDPYLVYKCFTGPLLPFQYRLVGPYSWPGAREAILGSFHNQFASLQPSLPLPRTAVPSLISARTIMQIILIAFLWILHQIL